MAAWAAGRARVSGHWAKITVPGHCDCFRTEAVAAPGAAARILPPATGSPAAGEVVPLGQPDSGPPQARVLRRRAGGGFLAAGSLAAMEAQLRETEGTVADLSGHLRDYSKVPAGGRCAGRREGGMCV